MNGGLEPVEKQARGLSSGTLSYLCHSTRYDEVDAVRVEFIEFCQENARRFETWQEAWREYAKIKGY